MNFQCDECGKCCSGGIVIIYPEDVEQISKCLSIDKKIFVSTFCKVEQINLNDFKNIEIFYFDNNDGCKFLDKNKLCTIHIVKPLQCKYSPVQYFQSTSIWKNCVKFSNANSNPFSDQKIDDEFFVEKLLNGYNLDD